MRGQSMMAELPVEQAACMAAPMEAAKPARDAVQAAAPAAGSALLPQDLPPATGWPVAQEAAGMCAVLAPAAATNLPEPAALVPAVAGNQASQQAVEDKAPSCQLQEAGQAALARPLQAGRDSSGTGAEAEGPDLVAPPGPPLRKAQRQPAAMPHSWLLMRLWPGSCSRRALQTVRGPHQPQAAPPPSQRHRQQWGCQAGLPARQRQ